MKHSENLEDRSLLSSEFLDHNPGEHIRRLQQMAQPGDCRELQYLSALQARTSRNYFRLLEADRQLRARAGGPTRSPGAILADTIEADHQRIGMELHTGVGQSLAGIQVHVGLIREAMPNPPEPFRRSLERIERLAGTALEQVRNVSRSLYVPAWRTQRLAEALRSLWESSGISERFAATLELDRLSAEPEPEVSRALYLAAQEGISNIMQHANAARVRMALAETDGRITLTLEDDGSGFAPSPGSAAPAGIGLRSLSDLAREVGGDFQTASGANGARLTISIPVSHE
ncbi:MAG: histidine kinase [Bryobacteraceae bacterium]